jgi:hypothetical protein
VTRAESAADAERTRRRRRRFAMQLSPVALLLISAGAVIGGRSGVLHVIGLAAMAYGIGLAVALIWLAAGRSPVARR